MYYRSVNSIFDRIGHSTHEDTILKLLSSKCLPAVCYGLDACPVSSSDKHSFEFMFTRTLMRLFRTGSMDILAECKARFGVRDFVEYINASKRNFLMRYCAM